MSENNLAVIGCGYWGKNLVRAFHGLDVLHTVCDIDKKILDGVQNKYSGISLALNVDEVISDVNIRAVAIAAPASNHYRLAKKALCSGKDVFVEKPLSMNYKEGGELVDIARDRDLILMVGHILHYHPAVQALKDLIAKGALGRIQYIYSNRLNFGKIRREENILWSFAPHDLSVILGLLGEEPTEVSAKGSYYLHPGIADVTMSQMKFASGVNAHVHVSWLHPYKEQKLVVIGDKQMVVFDDTAPWEAKLVLYPHEVVWENGVPTAKRAEGKVVNIDQLEPLRAECLHFLECIESRKEPITDGKEGLRGLKILNALQRSLDGNGTVVKMDGGASDFFVHETAVVDDGVTIGRGAKLWHFSHVMAGAEIGDGSSLGQNVVMMPGSKLGKNVKVQNNVSIYEGVVAEDDVFLGPSMVFTNVVNPRSYISRKGEYKKTLIRKGATIGANATIVCGNEIGEYAFVGSGSVVTKNIPAFALVYGNPARQQGWMCKCGQKLNLNVDDADEQTSCSSCGESYARSGMEIKIT